MVEAVIFDCFGVLAADGWLPFRQKYFGEQPQLFRQATELNKRTDAGLASYGEFIQEIALLAGIPDNEVRKQIENNPPNTELFEFIETRLKPRYKVGLLSNAAQNWLDEIFSPEQVAAFDAVGLSYEIGATKPAPITYETIAKKLNCRMSACVLVDDQAKYCEGARTVGMQAIHYRGADQTIKELHTLLALV
jgi:putative hydrolase of the HAD superfamily